MKRPPNRKQSFTLIELLAVLAIIGILFTIVSPQISKARLKGRMTQQAHRAKSIVEAIIAYSSSSRFSKGGWPQTGDANTETSTLFLAALVREGYLDVDYSFFAAPGMTPARDAAEFSAQNNAWCILRDLNDATSGNIPAVYMRSYDIGSETFSDSVISIGKKGFAFATKNGEASTVEGRDMQNSIGDIFHTDELENISVMKP